MTDEELVRKKLARIEECVRDLRKLADPSRLRGDLREQRFVEHTLQLAIQAVIDVASHIVSDDGLGEPTTNRQVVEALVRAGRVPDELRERLAAMISFRNVLVHEYDDVDLAVVERILQSGLDDLLLFATSIRASLRSGT